MLLDILYQDDRLVVINKPSGMLVHRTALSRDREFILQLLRDQLGQRIFPAHRLDRATSGVLVFALKSTVARWLNEAFQEQSVKKHYLAIVRGWPEPVSGLIDRPVKDDDRESHREARSRYERLDTRELAIANRRYSSSRYALMKLAPETGRRHQLRIHMERIAHPIIGDTTHGDGEHNRIFREHLEINRLMLHAWSLQLPDPDNTSNSLKFMAPPPEEWCHALDYLGWSLQGIDPFKAMPQN